MISSHQVWMPGFYVDTKAARYAFQFSEDELVCLEKKINHLGHPITTQDLRDINRGGNTNG